MIKVYDWERNKQPPENPTKYDLIFGIGYMNDVLMCMSERMSILIRRVSKLDDADVNDAIVKFDRSTLGKQVGILKEYYSGIEISEQKLNDIITKRNHFIHQFNIDNNPNLKSEAKNLSDLINLIRKMCGSLNNATEKVTRKNKVESNQNKQQIHNRIQSIILKCKPYESGRIDITEIAHKVNKEKGLEYTGKFYKYLESQGFQTHLDEARKTRYVDSSVKVTVLNKQKVKRSRSKSRCLVYPDLDDFTMYYD